MTPQQLLTPDEIRSLCETEGGQKAFAKRIRRSPQYVSNLCTGTHPVNPAIDQLIRLVFNLGE